MFRELHFPTPIYIADIKHPTLNQELERDIVAWSNKDKGIKRTNVQGWHSPTNMAELPEYKKLVDMLYACQKTIYDQEHLDSEPVLGNMWANINPPGGMNMPHLHPNCLFSGVYYVKSNPKSGRLKIMDPRPGAQMYMPMRKEGDPGRDMWRDANLEPIEGRIIMFPAWLWHTVEENLSDDIRISVSFNFIQSGYK